jgi:hypothetical protein
VPAGAVATPTEDDTLRFNLPTVTVTTQQPADQRRVPVSVTAVTREIIDTAYIPLAFPYPNFAPSGFVGEMGAPRSIGGSVGLRF